MTKEEQFVNELIGYIFAYPNDDYMTMECLCRKLVKHGLLDKVDGYYQTHEIRTNTHECVKDTHDKTEPSNSEIPNNCEPQTIRCPKCGRTDYIRDMEKDMGVKDSHYKYKCINCNTYIKDEPTISKMEQVDKDINVRSKDEPYIDIETGILHWCGWKYKRIYEDEPQTEDTCKECVNKTDCPWK